ncbi:DinB family protein [Streptomyces kunmingensis]|uniref:DinB family protein n=1 Tax=Streptomyces kunmingensis TaxID=68225 RepID=A0ABU6CMK7_9ACTN|nr:DinB family protein [Streptomyces kunmingensis]MEB3965689.1 DinB family protein [Streptomyces kunmingensis]
MSESEQSESEQKKDLLFYLQQARDALLWKLEGLSEYDVRRPLTPTGTNLLGLVKHVTAVELGYLCVTFGRPHDVPLGDPEEDSYATADETRELIVERYRRAWTHADTSVREVAPDTVGTVPWWQEGRNEVTFHHALVRVLGETQRHAGHADILREGLDGAAGWREDNDSLPSHDPAYWREYHDRLQHLAEQAMEK